MTTPFVQLSSDISDVVKSASAAVVRVEARDRIPATGIVWSGDGLIVSANHVVENDEDIRIGLDDGATVQASVVGRDPSTDLIALRAEDAELSPAVWAGADDVRVGGLAIAIGRPRQNVEVSVGALSAVNGAWRTPSGGRVDRYVRPEITMWPGFSGGPLVLAGGAFAGLNTSGLLHHADAVLPVETLTRVVETIGAHGRIPRGYLGVGVQPVRISAPLAESTGAEVGLMAMSVEEDSPALAAGLRQGDILIALDDRNVDSVSALRMALSSIDAEGAVTLRIIRSNEVMNLPVNVELR